jgi:hypothetical protein
MPTRESLTYAEAQKMVEFEVDGRVTRVSIFDPLPLMSKEEFEAKYGGSNDSVSAFICLNTEVFFTSLDFTHARTPVRAHTHTIPRLV